MPPFVGPRAESKRQRQPVKQRLEPSSICTISRAFVVSIGWRSRSSVDGAILRYCAASSSRVSAEASKVSGCASFAPATPRAGESGPERVASEGAGVDDVREVGSIAGLCGGRGARICLRRQ